MHAYKFCYQVESGINWTIFGVDNSLPVHFDNRRKRYLILGEGSTDGLDGTTITAEAK